MITKHAHNGAHVARDPALLRTGFIGALDHPETRLHAPPNLSVQLGRRPGGITSAAPCFGQHNEQILGSALGLTAPSAAADQSTDRPSAAPFHLHASTRQ